jgi:hypothetical protein
MSSESNDFLSRWSRRKIEVRQEASHAVAPAPVALAKPEEAEASSDQDGALTPEEIAALPSIDELTPETDITGFLRKGVPEFLKNAALRRMWSLDPAIRDYVGDARDYAYDWNMPGGVPGNGPLLPGENAEAVVAQIFGDEPSLSERLQAAAEEELAREPPSARETKNITPRSPDDPDSEDRDAASQYSRLPLPGAGTDARLLLGGGGVENAVLPGPASDGAPPSRTHPQAPAGPSPRRHGGAKPV